MNTTHAIDLIKMRHARAVAEIAAYTACASKDIAQYGSWSCDWSIGIGQATTEALRAEEEFDALVRHVCACAEREKAEVEFRLSAILGLAERQKAEEDEQ